MQVSAVNNYLNFKGNYIDTYFDFDKRGDIDPNGYEKFQQRQKAAEAKIQDKPFTKGEEYYYTRLKVIGTAQDIIKASDNASKKSAGSDLIKRSKDIFKNSKKVREEETKSLQKLLSETVLVDEGENQTFALEDGSITMEGTKEGINGFYEQQKGGKISKRVEFFIPSGKTDKPVIDSVSYYEYTNQKELQDEKSVATYNFYSNGEGLSEYTLNCFSNDFKTYFNFDLKGNLIAAALYSSKNDKASIYSYNFDSRGNINDFKIIDTAV